MAKKSVVEITCDKCGATEDIDKSTHNRSMPDNWVAFTARADGGYMFELELCPKCSKPIIEEVLKGFDT